MQEGDVKYGNHHFTGEKKTLISLKRKHNWPWGRSDSDTLLANIYQHADDSWESVGKLRTRHHKIFFFFFFTEAFMLTDKDQKRKWILIGLISAGAPVWSKEQHVPWIRLLEFAFVYARSGHPTCGGRNETTNCWQWQINAANVFILGA